MWEENTLQNARDEGSEQDAPQQGHTAVFFLHGRADDEEEEHIVQEMIPAAMAQHMAEKPDIEQRVPEGGAIDAEQVGGGPAIRPLAEEEHPQREQKEGEDDRRIILHLQREFGLFRSGRRPFG